MASVSSLDKDLRKMRLDKYTPAAANEARTWVEETIGERLPSSDLLDGLKDGVALCKLANLAIPAPGLRFKQSAMPFVQMENISLFLRACQAPPLNLHQHDTFLTVDLFERKDPAQVLQCLGAFSRAACAANPRNFPSPIGSRSQGTGPSTPTGNRDRGASITSNNSSAYGSSRPVLGQKTGDSASGRWSPTKSPTKSPRHGTQSPGSVSSWSKREHEGATSPAWNIAQYGYMGGASQGNLGISFGGRRQITTSGPSVPSLADKERRRREQEAEEGRLRQEAEEEERRKSAERQADEERARAEEERRWEEETRRIRDKERQTAEEERRKWEEEERQWKLTEEKRRKEEEEAEARIAEDRNRTRSRSDAKLRGQFLSQYQAEEAASQDGPAESGYKSRIQELEEELEKAREREAQYERERQERTQGAEKSRRGPPTESKPLPKKQERLASPPRRMDSWSKDEREVLRTPRLRDDEPQFPTLDEAPAPPPRSPRPLPDPISAAPPVKAHTTGGRPLPDPAAYAAAAKPAAPAPKPAVGPKPVVSAPAPTPASRTDRFLANNPAPAATTPQQTYSRELGATAERDAEDKRRAQSQTKTKAGGWASKSLLEREMEMERQRQREWEEAQQETANAVRSGDGVDGIGGGVGGRWDVGQWSGYTGGDGQNRGAQGIGAGRRQIVGPRPLPEPR